MSLMLKVSNSNRPIVCPVPSVPSHERDVAACVSNCCVDEEDDDELPPGPFPPLFGKRPLERRHSFKYCARSFRYKRSQRPLPRMFSICRKQSKYRGSWRAAWSAEYRQPLKGSSSA